MDRVDLEQACEEPQRVKDLLTQCHPVMLRDSLGVARCAPIRVRRGDNVIVQESISSPCLLLKTAIEVGCEERTKILIRNKEKQIYRNEGGI